MVDLFAELKHAARILHRQAQAQEAPAISRLRQLPELRNIPDEELAASVQRRHALAAVARELGFDGWSKLNKALSGKGEAHDFGDVFCPPKSSSYWNIWCASYELARTIREQRNGWLLVFRQQFFVVDEHYLRHLGLDPADDDWNYLGRDWTRVEEGAENAVRHEEARSRLIEKLLRRRLALAAESLG